MRTLARTALSPDIQVDPFPDVFPPFKAHGIQLHRGSLTMFAATPASGKSYLILKLLHLLKVPTLYFSADTSSEDQMIRAISIATGEGQVEVRENLMLGAEEFYSDRLNEAFGHVRWVFNTAPDYDDLELETCAFAEAHGDFPEIIVVDNLVNLVGDAESELQAQKDSTRVLQKLKSVTGASVWLAHHMNERKANPNYPSPRVDLANKVAQLPDTILSLAFDNAEGIMRVAQVKRRGAKQDPSAESYTTFYADLDRGQFASSKHNMELGVMI